jgi:hypothetical protein
MVAEKGRDRRYSDAWLCRRPVPPSPDLIAQLYARYRELVDTNLLPAQMSFEAFYRF